MQYIIDKLLPNEYQPVEYIEINGNQYINTQIVPTLLTKVRVKFLPLQTNTYGFFGARRDPLRFCCVTFSSGSSFNCSINNNRWPSYRITVNTSTIYDCYIENGMANVNGTNYNTTTLSTEEWSSSVGTFKLAGVNSNGAAISTKARYYICTIWENGVKVRNLIPCYRKSDNVIGMYDTVNGVFYTNAGSGSFAKGSNISNYIKKEIESNILIGESAPYTIQKIKPHVIIFDGEQRTVQPI